MDSHVKKIKEIELVFENLESADIDVNDICLLNFFKITNNISAASMHYGNVVCETRRIDKFFLVLNKKANDGLFESNNAKTLFERIQKFNDIIMVILRTDNGNTDKYYVKWKDNNKNENKYQTTAMTGDGQLVIAVAKKKTAEDVIEWLQPRPLKFYTGE